jgi:hypothetical protein
MKVFLKSKAKTHHWNISCFAYEIQLIAAAAKNRLCSFLQA